MRLQHSLRLLAGSALALAAWGCGGTEDLTTAQTSQALETAQCTFGEHRAAADACFQAFGACASAAGADADSCRAALRDCLPPPPPPRGRGEGCHADGGMGPRGPGGPGGPPPGGAGGHRPGPRQGGPGGPPPGGRAPGPDAAAVEACHAALEACLTATPGDAACFEAERGCMRGVFHAAFEAMCANAACDAATDPDCARLQQRCAEGIDGRPEAYTGGACP